MTEERFDNVNDIYQRLSGDARMLHIPPRLFEPKGPEALEECRQLVDNVILQGTISAGQLARRANIKASAISAFRNSKWKGSQGTLYTTAGTLARAIDQFIRQQEADETNITGFSWIRIAEQARDVIRYAQKRRKMGVIYAPAGSGKTTVLTVIKEQTPGAVMVIVKRKRGSVKSFLQLWARALGLQEHGRAEDIQDRIILCLTGTDRLILIDEAHKLQVATLDVIREVWDEVKCPIVLAGTPSFKQTLETRRVAGQATELMDQLYSRVAIFRDLSVLENQDTGDPEAAFLAEDIRKVFARGNVRLVKDAIDFLCCLANQPAGGGLRCCAELVQAVADLFPDETVTVAHLRKALELRLGPREAVYRMDQLGVAPEVAPAKVAYA